MAEVSVVVRTPIILSPIELYQNQFVYDKRQLKY